MINLRKRLTRFQFERLLKGKWKRVGRRRKNGDFSTWTEDPFKYISDGKQTLRATSWYKIARALKLV